MAKPAVAAGTMDSLAEFFDAAWYRTRYPDIAASNMDPVQHFMRFGIAERRDPNRYFDGAWYSEHYADVSASGIHPLLHYFQSGAAELRNPHPNFDAVWYADQHPAASNNPLLYHLKVGMALGYLTEKPLRIELYLPSVTAAFALWRGVVVDVVIPAYRGLDETRRCVESVLADRRPPLGRVIVVDDCSPEPALSAWLQGLAADGLIHLVRNRRNLGFVASVNRGMGIAGTHDVVLLNSDTEVPVGWLERLAAQAYADASVATVSPFSNNATICSYPSNDGGPVAFGRSLTQVDDICRLVNAGRWVDVPTTVGFCMYIKREALDQTGLFDAERFDLGYGEENDFCLRAAGFGWRHRLACDVFVYHAGSVSFGDRALKLQMRAMALILERFPGYQHDIARHVSRDDVAPFRFAMTAALFRASGLPVILMVSHALGGGVRRHVDKLVARLSGQAHFLLLEATDRGAALSVPELPGHPLVALPAERLDDLVALLRSANASRVHVHHLLGMDMDMFRLIKRLDVPFDITVHDYFAICPQINLLPWRYSLYCQEPDIAGCNACIAQRSSHGARDIVTWRGERAWQFHAAERVLCPSEDTLVRMRRYYPDANLVLAPHEAVATGTWPVKKRALKGGKLRIAVLGVLADHKGGRTVASVAEMADPKTTEIHLIGDVDGPFPELALRRMRISGRYDDDELASLIEARAPHVIWFPAAWPETFSYTLSAAITSGLPIAATRIGAHDERLAGRPLTWLAEVATSPAEWIGLFDNIQGCLASGAVEAPLRPAVADFYAEHYLRRPARPASRKRPLVAIVPERFDAGFPTPCAYIRLLQPFSHPAVAADLDVVVTDHQAVLDMEADIIVTQRFALPDLAAANRLAGHARRIGAKLVFDLDDDLLHIPANHPDSAELRPHAKVVRRLLTVADAVWLSSPGLMDRLSALRPDAVLIENQLDERIWLPGAGAPSDGPVRILAMGTTSHDHDFKMIVPALARLKAEYGDKIVIDVIGMTPGANDLPPGLTRISPPHSAARSYPGFVSWLSSVDPGWHLGLAPLLDSAFTRCKSPIKVLDYAALGMAVLASDTPVYRGCIADGICGQLVADNGWYAAIDRLLRNRERLLGLAGAARGAFLDRGSLARHGCSRRDVLERLLGAGLPARVEAA